MAPDAGGESFMNLKQLESKLTNLTPNERSHRAHPERLSSRYDQIDKRSEEHTSELQSQR